MTGKQIIIDGVDVVKCPHRKKEVTFMNVIKCYNYGACEGVNCLYKQLKAKEQECERLKSELSETIGAIDNVRKAKEYYQQECEKLQKENEEWQKKLDKIYKEKN